MEENKINEQINSRRICEFLQRNIGNRDFNDLLKYSIESENLIYTKSYKSENYLYNTIVCNCKNNELYNKLRFYLENIDIFREFSRYTCDWYKFDGQYELYDRVVVTGHCHFFHGTSYENYMNILNSGIIKTSDINETGIDKLLGIDKMGKFNKGKLYISDDFALCVTNALKKGTKGVVMCIDLHGVEICQMYNREDREYFVESDIPLERIVNVYIVEYIDNKIVIS